MPARGHGSAPAPRLGPAPRLRPGHDFGRHQGAGPGHDFGRHHASSPSHDSGRATAWPAPRHLAGTTSTIPGRPAPAAGRTTPPMRAAASQPPRRGPIRRSQCAVRDRPAHERTPRCPHRLPGGHGGARRGPPARLEKTDGRPARNGERAPGPKRRTARPGPNGDPAARSKRRARTANARRGTRGPYRAGSAPRRHCSGTGTPRRAVPGSPGDCPVREPRPGSAPPLPSRSAPAWARPAGPA